MKSLEVAAKIIANKRGIEEMELLEKAFKEFGVKETMEAVRKAKGLN